MKVVKLNDIAYARSGDKGSASNVGIIFINKKIYNWALENLTEEIQANYFKDIASLTTIDIQNQPNAISGKDLKDKFKHIPNFKYKKNLDI